jgi:hypothetical protein
LYLLLDEDGQERIARERLLELEREHCSLVLRVAEMDGIGVPPSARGRLALLRDLDTVEATINWHRERMGIAERVEPGPPPETGDDEPTEPRPVGEEAPK